MFVNQYFWNFQFSPLADRCFDQTWQPHPDDNNGGRGPPGVSLYCVYEEQVFNQAPQPRWFEFREEDVIFYLTKTPLPFSSFSGDPETN